jgi:protein TonB
VEDPELPAEPVVEPAVFPLAEVPAPADPEVPEPKLEPVLAPKPDPVLAPEPEPDVLLWEFIALDPPPQPGRDVDPPAPLLPDAPGEVAEPAPVPIPPAPPAPAPPAPPPAPCANDVATPAPKIATTRRDIRMFFM